MCFHFPPSLEVTTRPSFSITVVLSSFAHQKTYAGQRRAKQNLTFPPLIFFFSSSAGLASTGFTSPRSTLLCTQCRRRITCGILDWLWRLHWDIPALFSLGCFFVGGRWGNRQWTPNHKQFITPHKHTAVTELLEGCQHPQQEKEKRQNMRNLYRLVLRRNKLNRTDLCIWGSGGYLPRKTNGILKEERWILHFCQMAWS